MEPLQPPQPLDTRVTYRAHKEKQHLLIILGILVAVFIFLIFVVTKPARTERRVERQDIQDQQDADAQEDDNRSMSPDPERAPVTMVNIELLESFPVQARVVVTGIMPTACAQSTVDTIDYDETKRMFSIILGLESPQAASCPKEPTAYSEFIPLDITGLPAGRYTVSVNGVSASFTLDTANEISYELDKG